MQQPSVLIFQYQLSKPVKRNIEFWKQYIENWQWFSKWDRNNLLKSEGLATIRNLYVYKCHVFYDNEYLKCKYVDRFIIKLLETDF